MSTQKHIVAFETTANREEVMAALEMLLAEDVQLTTVQQTVEKFATLAKPVSDIHDITPTRLVHRTVKASPAKAVSKLVFIPSKSPSIKPKINVAESLKALGLTRGSLMHTDWPYRSDQHKVKMAIRMNERIMNWKKTGFPDGHPSLRRGSTAMSEAFEKAQQAN